MWDSLLETVPILGSFLWDEWVLFATQTMSRRDKGDAMDETPFDQVLSGKLMNIPLLSVVVGGEVLGLSFNTSFLIVVEYSECHWLLNMSTALSIC